MFGEQFEPVLDAARAGGAWAFDRLYADLAGPVVGYLRLQGAREPEDLTNEVFLGVFTGLGRFTGDEPAFRSWVFTIAHRRLIDERRRHGRRPDIGGDRLEYFEVGGGDVEDEAFAVLGEAWVREVCSNLVPDQRTVLLLRILADLSIDQVAELVGKSPGAVKQLQRRGLLAVRRVLEREGVPL